MLKQLTIIVSIIILVFVQSTLNLQLKTFELSISISVSVQLSVWMVCDMRRRTASGSLCVIRVFYLLCKLPASRSMRVDKMAAKIEAKGYGKNFVRVMWLKRQGDVHSISELSVNVELELLTTVDYEKGDNKDVVATDSQKNTILALAKKHGVSLLFCPQYV